MKKGFLVLFLLLLCQSAVAGDFYYGKFFYPAEPYNGEKGFFPLEGNFVFSGSDSLSLEFQCIFRPVMVWAFPSNGKEPKQFNPNIGSRFNPEVKGEYIGNNRNVVTLDFKTSKTKPTNAEMNIIMFCIVRTSQFTNREIGVKFKILGLPNFNPGPVGAEFYLPKDLPTLMANASGHSATTPNATDVTKACHANLRVLLGAVEMYNMDHEAEMITKFDDSMAKPDGILVKEKYLHGPIEYPDPKCHYESDGDLSGTGKIRCALHGSL